MSSNTHAVLLSVKNLSFVVGDQTILSDVSFEVTAGEQVAVFGPSGAGKSTLIRLLNRLDEPTSGTVFLEGQDYRQVSPQALRQRLGLVMQNPYLFPGTVADNLRFGPEARGERLDEETLEALLEGVDLAGFADRDVSKLSGGEAQRVNLARTLANKPDVLLLDEPTSSLDREAKQDVEDTILSVIQAQSVTCILVTHERKQVQRMAERVLLLKNGKLIGDGPVVEVMDAQSLD